MKLLSNVEKNLAMDLYYSFFKRHPKAKNPTDLNTKEKYLYAMEIGYDLFKLMGTARKYHTKRNNFPYPWTHQAYWEDKLDRDVGNIHRPAPMYTYKRILEETQQHETKNQ